MQRVVFSMKEAHCWPEDVYSLWWGREWSGGRCSGTPGRGSAWQCNKGTQTHRHTQRTLLRKRSCPAGRSHWFDCRYMSVCSMGAPTTWMEAEREKAFSNSHLMTPAFTHLLCDFREKRSSPGLLLYPRKARRGNMKGLRGTCKILQKLWTN